MSKVSLNPVRYYDITDIYTASVDNRPLKDISSNIDLLNSAVQALGFYQELYAALDSEPSGGFAPFTCVALSKQNRLVPIDISLSPLAINYADFPIYLILEGLDNSLYKCISFSSSLTLPSISPSFLSESIGRALKVGPGGTLVDEIYFDLYYGMLSYQHLVVGKVLTQSSFSFGGNQVNTLTANKFLAKNRSDSTTGLVTRLIDLQDSHTAFNSTIIPESIALSGETNLYTSYINSVSGGAILAAPSQSPVYFSYLPLQTDATGNLSSTTSSILNEVHFASVDVTPTINGAASLTTGVNVGSLLTFASSYTLHSTSYSTYLNETSQSLNTSLSLIASSDSDSTPSSLILEPLLFPYKPRVLDTSFLLDSNILSFITSSEVPSVSFGNYLPSSANSSLGGGFIGLTTDSGTAETNVTYSFDENGPGDFSNTNSLILYSKKATGNTSAGAAALYLLSDGYLVLGATEGAFYPRTPSLGYEVTNKKYVDSLVNTVSSTLDTKIPYIGTTSDNPVTGSLYFDTTTSTTPTVVLQFKTLRAAEIQSVYPIQFKTDAGDFQAVQGIIDPDPSKGSNNDFTTREYVSNAIADVTSGSSSAYVDKTSAQTVVGIKTFSKNSDNLPGGIVISDTAELQVQTADTADATINIIRSSDTAKYFAVKTPGDEYVKLYSATTENTDEPNTVVTKDYIPTAVSEGIGNIFNSTAAYCIWGKHSVSSKTSAFSGYSDWFCLTQGTYTSVSSAFATLFGNSIGSSDGLVYIGTKPALFLVTASDSRNNNKGPDLGGGIWRSQLAIVVKRGGSVTNYAYNIHQDDTDGNSINSLVATSASCVIDVQPNDQIGILTEWAEHGCASLTLLRYL